jgi:hypothetical protein
MGGWSHREGFHIQHLWNLFARMFINLYHGSWSGAGERVKEVWLKLRDSQLMRLTSVRIQTLYYRAVVEIASAPSVRALEMLSALRSVRALEAEVGPHARAYTLSARGLLAARLGDRAKAAEFFHLSAARFERGGMLGFAMAARYRRAELLEGEPAQAELERVARWFREQGVLRPERAVRIVVPDPAP